MTDGKKKTFRSIEYGTTDGQLRFGHLHGKPDSDVQSDVMLQASDPLHYMSMDKNGKRDGWTVNRCPNVWEVKCGDKTKPDKPAFYVEAVNGDIVLKATNGRIRLQGLDIDLIATGPNSKRGVIDIRSNQAINLDSNKIDFKAKTSLKMVSSGAGEMAFNQSLKMYAGFSQCITGSVGKSGKDSKYGIAKEYAKKYTDDRV